MNVITDRRMVTAGLLGFLATPALAENAGALPYPTAALWHIDTPPARDGFAPGPNGPIYFRVYGNPGLTPVIVLHGGPAAGELYMRPYVELAKGRQVILYDQSGCGRSARPADPGVYTVDSYVSELDALQDYLGFEKVILLGHSWGGFLAPSYAAHHPDRVKALVLAGSATSMQDFTQAATIWLKELGPEAPATVARNAAPGAVLDPRYDELIYAYYQRHLLRIDPWPEFFLKAGADLATNPVYLQMNGPSEIQFTGTLAALDFKETLRAVQAPTLVTCGQYDEAPRWVAEKVKHNLRSARIEVFDGLSHMSHLEDPERVIAATARFLASVDRG